MGTYLYLLRSPKLARRIVVERSDGTTETVTAGAFAFLCKDSWGRRGDSLISAQIARMESIWGSNRPQFAVHTSGLESGTLNTYKPSDPRRFRIEVGAPVHYWPALMGDTKQPAPVLTSDGSGSIGKVYGKVKEVLSS